MQYNWISLSILSAICMSKKCLVLSCIIAKKKQKQKQKQKR